VGDARRCPACERIYWPGSHHRRMRARLEAWAAGAFDLPGAARGRLV
jgi:uncharacterized protein with PIN domain